MLLFSLYYWVVAVVAVSLIFIDILGSYGASLLMSVMMLPGILFAKIHWKDLSVCMTLIAIEHLCYFVLIVMIIEFYSIITVYYFLFRTDSESAPDILLNPLFIWFIIGSLLSIESILRSRLLKSHAIEPPRHISFISNRSTITLEIDQISYIESNDTEVLINTLAEAYVSKMKISQWENILDDRFIRVHRSFLVNKRYVGKIEGNSLYLGAVQIPISRKYKPQIKVHF